MALVIDLTRLSAAYAPRLRRSRPSRRPGRAVVGDDVRRAPPFVRGRADLEHGAYHQFLNAGKESVLAPETPAGADALAALVRMADASSSARRSAARRSGSPTSIPASPWSRSMT